MALYWNLTLLMKHELHVVTYFFVIQGINLSGGQRQRICVARALYQNTNIVFLVSVVIIVCRAQLDEINGPAWPLGRGGVRLSLSALPSCVCLSGS